MTLKHKLIKRCLLVIVIFLVTFGFALWAGSFLTFESIKAMISALIPPRKHHLVTKTLFEQIIIRARFIGIIIFLTGGLLFIFRQYARQYIYDVLTSFPSFWKEIKKCFYDAVIKEDKIHLFALFIILVAAIAVRVTFLFQPMRYDEAYTFLFCASKPLYFGLSNYYAPNNHLFHTFLVHITYLLFGNQLWVIRLPALFAGILLVPASYMVARIFYDKYTGLLTAGIIASSSVLIEYSTNARGYTLLCLFFLLILSLGVYLIKNRNLAAWFLFSILSALGFYTIPIMLYPFGIVIVWLIFSTIFEDTNLSRKILYKDLFISLIIISFLTFILYTPVLVGFGLESVIGNRFVESRSWSYFVENFPPSLYLIWTHWNRDVPTVISFLLVIGFFTSLVFHRRLTSYTVPIVLAVGIWLIPVLMFQRVVPFKRVWLFLFPLFAILASSGVSYLLRLIESKIINNKSFIVTLLAVALSFWLNLNVVTTQSVYYSNETGTLRDAEEITIFLKDYLKPKDRVLAPRPSNLPLEYYFKTYDVPVKYLSSDLNSSRRILIIVNKSKHQTLWEILDKEGLLGTNLNVPKSIRHYESATLYEIYSGLP